MLNVITIGAINWDINLFVTHLPKEGEEVRVLSIERVPGGTAANVAVAAARYLGPNKTGIIGAVGGDEIGYKQIDILRDEEVVTNHVLRVEGVESGQAYILIDPRGVNVINTFFGANLMLTIDYINAITSVLRNTKVKVVTDPPLEVAIRILEVSNGYGINIWDPGVYIEYGLNKLLKGIRLSDILVLNHVEVNELFGTLKTSVLIEKMNNVKCDMLVIKYGSKGSQLIDLKNNIVVKVSALPLEKIGLNVINTVGCGDAYLGVFSGALSEGKNIIDAMLLATCAGGYKASKPETRGSPNRDVLIKLFNEYKRYININIENI